jgi:DNA mismatch repair ATPase MutL
MAVQVINERGYPRQAESIRLRPPQPLELSPSEEQVLLHHKAHAEAWGWRFAESKCGSASQHVLTHAAAVLGVPLNVTELQVSDVPSFVTVTHEMKDNK